MTTSNIHEEQAKHNYSLLKMLDGKSYRDWRITIAYYTAIHVIDGKMQSALEAERKKLLAESSKMSIDFHFVREKALEKYAPREVWSAFMTLKKRSMSARYLDGINDVAFKALSKADEDDCIKIKLKLIMDKFSSK